MTWRRCEMHQRVRRSMWGGSLGTGNGGTCPRIVIKQGRHQGEMVGIRAGSKLLAIECTRQGGIGMRSVAGANGAKAVVRGPHIPARRPPLAIELKQAVDRQGRL